MKKLIKAEVVSEEIRGNEISYIKFNKNKIKDTVEVEVCLDLDKENRIVGIELLGKYKCPMEGM